jgi:hypothetical protein
MEIIMHIILNDADELLLKLESAADLFYQYVYRAVAGVDWD